MLGGLYLSYGEHRLAGEIFERVLAKSVDPALNDRCWFFLAKIWHERGYQPEAEAALGRITGALPKDLEPQRQMLTAEVLMSQGRFADALTVLEAWKKPGDEWVGVREVQHRRRARAVRARSKTARAFSTRSVSSSPKTPQLAALRDKANVALGYAWLQASRPVEAKPSLERVRLEGPFSNKALLGVGWSDAENKNYRGALAPWLALNDRNLLDSAVQESLLAVPYAYAQLGARQAGGRSLRRGHRRVRRGDRPAHDVDRRDRARRPDHRAARRASRRGRRRVGMVLALGQGAGHDREPIPL